MRDRIARALEWVLRLLLPTPGKHRAVYRSAPHVTPPTDLSKDNPSPSRPVICAPRTPIPVHVLVRTMPIPPSTRPLVPLYMQHWQKELEKRERQRQRCVALVAGAMGYDYEYTYDGAHAHPAVVTA
ncbi:hypothetical protein B7P34_06625 [Streptosporangium nondiastaticum]|uniref:Uncharacterized protein n=1 Tax=Streptosporangium nondiastaticum TaxID=35764 RepID=A0A9X7JTC0_9ACTN|nr:hypothetical protein [Streptosporangium nondiastaticum]PSJ29538.1 hypothetical protein B7P34_06625 [Streptosporangium nondiastaticum]